MSVLVFLRFESRPTNYRVIPDLVTAGWANFKKLFAPAKKGAGAVFGSEDRVAKLLLVVMLTVFSYLILLPFCPSFQRFALKRFHLSLDSFALWAIAQPIPAMYSFENRYWIQTGDSPIDLKRLDPRQLVDRKTFYGPLCSKPVEGVVTGLINHYPGKLFTSSSLLAAPLLRRGEVYQGLLYSRFGSSELYTKLALHIRGQTSQCPSPQATLIITRSKLP